MKVRVDSGIQQGSDISIYYDPMISKVSWLFFNILKVWNILYTDLLKEGEYIKELINQYFKGARHDMPQGNMKEVKEDVE